MNGKNELRLCALEMLVALQEYVDKRWGTYAPKVTDVQFRDHNYIFCLEGKSPTASLLQTGPLKGVAYTDPCPQCEPGAACNTTGCGRYTRGWVPVSK